jgi:hypothetical protein
MHIQSGGARNDKGLIAFTPITTLPHGDEAATSTLTDLGPSHFAALRANILQLEGDVEQLRAERNRLVERQARIMELLGTSQPERLLHDIRNILNERQLLRTLMETES